MAGNPSGFDPYRILAHKFPQTTLTYTERDVALYALGIGACCREAVDADELKYVYNENGQENIEVLPTFAALFIHEIMKTGLNLPGLSYDPKLLLHGQQYIELYKPLPSNGYVRLRTGYFPNQVFYVHSLMLKYIYSYGFLRAQLDNKISLAGLHDKGKAAIVEIETKSYDKKSGQLLCMNRTTLFLRGAGGFSSSSHPYSYTNYPKLQGSVGKIPKTQPFAVYEDCTQPSQALLYRLSGDYNPLHSDPMVANIAGFSKPILHGLCTLGFAVRAIIKCVCKGDSRKVKCISGKFLLHVYPGESLVTEMWLEGSRVLYQTKVKERNRAVLSGYVDLHHIASSL